MGEIRQTNAVSMKKGNYIIIDGVACIVHGTQTSKPGKHGHSKVRIDAEGILDGKSRQIVMPGQDMVDIPIIDKRTAQVLSIHGDAANVMDSETYETFDLKIPEELKDQITEGVNVLYWTVLDEKVMKQIKTG